MDLFTILATAVGLSMDAFAVSVSSGITAKDPLAPKALRMGLAFGLSQAIMPLLGYFAGMTVVAYIQHIDHYVVFLLLGFVGGKMLMDGIRSDDDCAVRTDAFALGPMTLLAIATSIDALAVGIGFAAVSADIWLSAAIIGVVTFSLCYMGVYFGKRLGCAFQKKAVILGGIVLILIGLKILLEHLGVL
ncbi:MAG: manganese efflux pump [Clostridiales bacterium]|nr:manganese efflux pump [Clostridiales bacterium]